MTRLIEIESRPHNSTYKKLAAQWVNEAWCFVSSSVVVNSFRLRNRQLLVAAIRCRAFKKKQTVNKKLKYGILTIGVIILIGFVFKGKITHEKFDSDKWKNWTESETEWSLRWDMINSLRNNYELKGMSQKQIIELLGEPESKTDSEFAYYLGYSKRGINTGRLTIKFKNNKVTDFQVLDG